MYMGWVDEKVKEGGEVIEEGRMGLLDEVVHNLIEFYDKNKVGGVV